MLNKDKSLDWETHFLIPWHTNIKPIVVAERKQITLLIVPGYLLSVAESTSHYMFNAKGTLVKAPIIGEAMIIYFLF